ncbi:MAG: orotidine-5'-phosphate decarboxylase [Solirubrobacteraceae bacterium]
MFSSADTAGQPFGDRLSRRVQERESQLVLGLDPDPARLWPTALDHAGDGSSADRAGRAVAMHCRLVIDAAGPQCVAVKPQVACFERLGAPGWSALASTVAYAHEHGLLVICDGKRGDIDVSARAYAQAYFGETETPFGAVSGLGADALTVNPLLGLDSLAPMAEIARSIGGGLFILVRTSNRGAADIQDLQLTDGQPVSARLAAMVTTLAGSPGRSGLGDIGAVTGATAPEHLARLREAMPTAPFLLPGVGAQGGRVEDLAPAFAPGPAGGLVSSSRGIVFAYETTGGEPGEAAEREAARLRELAWNLCP